MASWGCGKTAARKLGAAAGTGQARLEFVSGQPTATTRGAVVGCTRLIAMMAKAADAAGSTRPPHHISSFQLRMVQYPTPYTCDAWPVLSVLYRTCKSN